MKYYKIIIGDKFVGVGTSIDLRKFQQKHSVFFACDESEAQYIQCNGKLYHDMWMLPVSAQSYAAADVKEIEQDEYEALFAAASMDNQILITVLCNINLNEMIATAESANRAFETFGIF